MESVIVKCMRRDFGERVRSLLEDGYCVRTKGETPECLFARLHHMCNGNDIVIKVYKKRGLMTQHTNHVETHRNVYV